MSKQNDLYRLELEVAAEVFGNEQFLSVNEIAKRTGKPWETIRRLFDDDILPPTGISKARYAYALSRQRTPKDKTYKTSRDLQRRGART